MDVNKKSKALLVGFVIFLFFMWLCTLISKSLYAAKLPLVSTAVPERKYIEHIVEAEGIVEPGKKHPVTSHAGLRVEALAVNEGDTVREGDLLFTIDMEDLAGIIYEKQNDIKKIQANISTLLKNQALDAQKKALEEQRAREDYNAEAVRQDILVGRAAEDVAQAENEIDNSDDPGSKELQSALQAAAYGEADAKWNRQQTLKDAARKIEDILFPEKEDASLTGYRLQIQEITEDIARYQDIMDAEGHVYSDQGGVVTDLYIDTGSRLPDTAVMLLSDDTIPCRLRVTLTKEQKKYLGLGDEVTIKLEGKSSGTEAVIDYLAENEQAPGTYTAIINLPEGTGKPGIAGTITHRETGELYPCCIHPAAICLSETRSYIYLLKERQGILGTEYYAEETNIKILDKNDSFAAIEGAINGDDRIIMSGTKEYQNGDTVRIY